IAEVELMGSADVRELEVEPSTAGFGEVPVTETGDPVTVTVQNTGTELPVTIEPLGPLPAGFTVVNDECGLTGSSAVTLPPDEQCDVAFAFTPERVGSVTAALPVTSDAFDAPHEVTFEATGTGSVIDVTPDELTTTVEQDAAATV